MLLLLLSLNAHAGLPIDGSWDEATDDSEDPLPVDQDALPVTNGTLVQSGDWTATAAIYFGNSVECTGVLIAPTLALTAGHCAGGITKIKVGTNNYRNGGELINVADEIAYPNWERSYDVTLLILESAATTPPVTIAQDCILDDDLYNGAEAWVVGYGAYDDQGNRYDAQLREGLVYIEDADCTDVRSGCVRSISPGGEVGAGNPDEQIDSCYGDSGGPLYLDTDRGVYVVGITSRAYNTVSVPCGEGGIYVRPDAIIDWIEEESGITLDKPQCGPPNEAPVPTADDIEVGRSDRGTTQIVAHDPDTDQGHTYAVSIPPDHGAVEISRDGVATYIADGGYKGEDRFTVRVTDDGVPPLSGEVLVKVNVSGCGCQSVPGAASGGIFAALGLLIGRRRRA